MKNFISSLLTSTYKLSGVVAVLALSISVGLSSNLSTINSSQLIAQADSQLTSPESMLTAEL
jgi:hypothetical protein